MDSDAIATAKKAEKLNGLFKDFAPSNSEQQGKGWELLWSDGRWLPWERGKTNPALEDALTYRQDLLGTAVSTPKGSETDSKVGVGRLTPQRRRALVPGCGRGYDVCMLRGFGWETTGLDISPTALIMAQEEKQKIDLGQRPEMGYHIRDPKIGPGSAEFVVGDFFDWGKGGGECFDLIYDYTFLSAIPPELRADWAATIKRLLSTDGRLICVEFPSDKDVASGGPPWGLPEEVYLAHLGQPGEVLKYDDDGSVCFGFDSSASPRGLVRIARWRPQRTHEAGKGRDWVSIWKHA